LALRLSEGLGVTWLCQRAAHDDSECAGALCLGFCTVRKTSREEHPGSSCERERRTDTSTLCVDRVCLNCRCTLRKRKVHSTLNQCIADTLLAKPSANDQANYAPDRKVIESLNSTGSIQTLVGFARRHSTPACGYLVYVRNNAGRWRLTTEITQSRGTSLTAQHAVL
jgi:hypothetical protein